MIFSRAARANKRRLASFSMHGRPHSSKLYEGVMDELSEDFFTLAFDLPGIGESRGSPPSAEKTVIAEIILDAAEKLGGHSLMWTCPSPSFPDDYHIHVKFSSGAGTNFAPRRFPGAAFLTTGINYWFFTSPPLADN